MSSAASYPRCAVDVGPSRALLLYALFPVAAALAAPWLAQLAPVAALPLNTATLALSLPLFRWARGPLRRIAWLPEGRWLLVDRAGREHEANHLHEGVFVGARLLALRWRCGCCQAQFRVALVADNCDVDSRRRLGVRLRATPDEQLFGKDRDLRLRGMPQRSRDSGNA